MSRKVWLKLVIALAAVLGLTSLVGMAQADFMKELHSMGDKEARQVLAGVDYCHCINDTNRADFVAKANQVLGRQPDTSKGRDVMGRKKGGSN